MTRFGALSVSCVLAASCLARTFVPARGALPWDCPENPSRCLSGAKHKEEASPEDSSYAACLEYKDSSCCTADFTQQLAQSTVTEIRDGDDVFSWAKCGALSEECEAYLIEVSE